jgi:hypothetical protein
LLPRSRLCGIFDDDYFVGPRIARIKDGHPQQETMRTSQ